MCSPSWLRVIAVALLGGLVPAVVEAIAGWLLLNFYFTPPVHKFTIAEAAPRTAASSPTPHPPPGPAGSLAPSRPHSPAARTCRGPAPPARPAPGCALPGHPRAARPKSCTALCGPEASLAPSIGGPRHRRTAPSPHTPR